MSGGRGSVGRRIALGIASRAAGGVTPRAGAGSRPRGAAKRGPVIVRNKAGKAIGRF